MAGPVARRLEHADVDAVVRQLHGLVTYGPRDLHIAAAMSAHGYDAVKWAEGQCMLAELVSRDSAPSPSLTKAVEWYREASAAAQRSLAAEPQLLAKLGLAELGAE